MSTYVNLSEVYEQGIEEGRRQILADLARMYKDELSADLPDVLGDYLEEEGYL